MPSSPSVCESVVPSDLCIGCGVCAATCPVQVLEMHINQFGEYVVAEKREGCLPNCDLCLQVCPFGSNRENESTLADARYQAVPGIQHRSETGYYLDCYIGHSRIDSHRIHGASGGLATWFLEKLLEDKIVDRVVCVVPTGDAGKLFRFAVLDSTDSVRRASRSCYYPVEIRSALREVMAVEARYAITGLPCLHKAIQLAMCRNRRLRERVAVQVGLTCGQNKSRFFSEYVAALGGGDPDQLTGLQFRVKDPKRPASDWGLGFECTVAPGMSEKGTVFWTEGMGRAWRNGYFRLNPCNLCDDLFAEVADVTFMDAWLPGYREDPRGHSLVINRSMRFKATWDDELAGDHLELDLLPVEQVISSQRSQLLDKREAMQYRCFLTQKAGKQIPQKRWPPEVTGNILDRWLWRIRMQTGHTSREIWATKKNLSSLQAALRATDMLLSVLTPLHWGLRVIRDGRVRKLLARRVRRVTKVAAEE